MKQSSHVKARSNFLTFMYVSSTFTGMVLSLFLRGVGIVGHVPEEDEKTGDEEAERHDIMHDKGTYQGLDETRKYGL